MMSAAAVLATTGGSVAANAGSGSASFAFGTAGGGAYCDGGIATYNGVVYSWIHNLETGCGESFDSYGQGLLGKVKGYGTLADMSDNYLSVFGIYTEYLSYTLPAKAKVGKDWTLWVGLSGVSSFEGNSGVLLAGPPAKHQAGAKTVSSYSAVKNAIAKEIAKEHGNKG